MYALQATQAELQTLHALTVELNRLRQAQPHATNGISPQFGQAGLNVQFTTHQTPNHFPHSTVYIPPSPVTRHGGTSYASAIPSGSQDLPEGVSIPPGWTLLPLQRLDGQPLQYHAGTPPVPVASPFDLPHQQHQATAPFSRYNFTPNPNGGVGSSTLSADVHNSTRHSDAQHGTDRNSEASTSRIQREPPNVAAPTPVVPPPPWGSSSHLLFGNRGSSSTMSTTGNPSSGNESTTGARSHAAESSDSDDEGSDASSGKGKAKAVTIEDVEDDDSD
ncbi:hypothetical protein O1611_g6741 [Lasiodiplodia mahajangana]|uniref:Uncharacterized protein n=1 Tax=Lasiodiplodia mahajangana TaxID=1108764 RepID=A0ACC2JHR3_9PEZI|nr:hypothetical protein O1611_g6741 [Lasiodiplodia mahajangana]